MSANIPPLNSPTPEGAFLRLLNVLDTLRTQCPWDKKQTMETLRHLTIEETHAFKSVFHAPALKRDRGTGRPTKKDRRETDDLLDTFFEDD